jgi:hypothetical protein
MFRRGENNGESRAHILPGALRILRDDVRGESAGLPAAFAALSVYFFLCQFLLSRNHPNAHREDWRDMLLLDGAMLVFVLIVVAQGVWDIILSQGTGMLLSTCGGTYAGAVVASVTAKRTVAALKPGRGAES